MNIVLSGSLLQVFVEHPVKDSESESEVLAKFIQGSFDRNPRRLVENIGRDVQGQMAQSGFTTSPTAVAVGLDHFDFLPAPLQASTMKAHMLQQAQPQMRRTLGSAFEQIFCCVFPSDRSLVVVFLSVSLSISLSSVIKRIPSPSRCSPDGATGL